MARRGMLLAGGGVRGHGLLALHCMKESCALAKYEAVLLFEG